MKIKSIFSALLLMASTMASAQYLNVKLKDGTYSFKTSSDMEVSFGAKAETNTINGHAYVELAGLKWATANVGSVENGQSAVAVDLTYGLYYAHKIDNVEYAKQAAESWGGTWKLPTEAQWKALMDENNCTWTWKDNYSFNGKNMNGYIVSDKSDSSKFIFLPAAGIYYDGSSDVNDQGYRGYYWSADDESFLNFVDGDRFMTSYFYLNHGMAVRPVSE